jgi:hypothetical protein
VHTELSLCSRVNIVTYSCPSGNLLQDQELANPDRHFLHCEGPWPMTAWAQSWPGFSHFYIAPGSHTGLRGDVSAHAGLLALSGCR